MIEIIRTDSTHSDFVNLVKQLDSFLKTVDGDENEFYHQYNGIENLNHVVVAYLNKTAVGCGSFKPYNNHTVEIKRMYVVTDLRSKGIATIILNDLEKWAKELNYSRCILETGKRQTEAIQLYKKNFYTLTANYPPYEGVDNSLCFEKLLSEQ